MWPGNYPCAWSSFPQDRASLEGLKQALESYAVPGDLTWRWEEEKTANTLEDNWTELVHSHWVTHSTTKKCGRWWVKQDPKRSLSEGLKNMFQRPEITLKETLAKRMHSHWVTRSATKKWGRWLGNSKEPKKELHAKKRGNRCKKKRKLFCKEKPLICIYFAPFTHSIFNLLLLLLILFICLYL